GELRLPVNGSSVAGWKPAPDATRIQPDLAQHPAGERARHRDRRGDLRGGEHADRRSGWPGRRCRGRAVARYVVRSGCAPLTPAWPPASTARNMRPGTVIGRPAHLIAICSMDSFPILQRPDLHYQTRAANVPGDRVVTEFFPHEYLDPKAPVRSTCALRCTGGPVCRCTGRHGRAGGLDGV